MSKLRKPDTQTHIRKLKQRITTATCTLFVPQLHLPSRCTFSEDVIPKQPPGKPEKKRPPACPQKTPSTLAHKKYKSLFLFTSKNEKKAHLCNISGRRNTAPSTLDLITRTPSHPRREEVPSAGHGLRQPLSPGCSWDSRKQAEASAHGVIIAQSPCTNMESRRRRDHRSLAAHSESDCLTLWRATVGAGKESKAPSSAFLYLFAINTSSVMKTRKPHYSSPTP